MKSDTRATHWSLTIWMPPYTEDSAREMCERACAMNPKWSIQGQLEKGKDSDGKLHYQLFLKTPQIRFTAVQKFFPSVHIEEARNGKALEKYVHKPETRAGEFKTIENRYVQWPLLRNKFFEWLVQSQDVMILAHTREEERLELFDEFIGLSIREGIECDIMGVNPQYRSCISRYWSSYIHRQEDKDRQISVDKTQTDSQEVSLPMNHTP